MTQQQGFVVDLNKRLGRANVPLELIAVLVGRRSSQWSSGRRTRSSPIWERGRQA